jgi:hypothetical protein
MAMSDCDDYEGDDFFCDHEDADLDILDGRYRCLCGYSWLASEAEILSAIDAQAAYSEYEDRENRRQWWRDLWERVRSMFPRRKPAVCVTDDEVPF